MQLLVLFTLFYSLSGLSYQSSVTDSQNQIKWNYTNVPLRIVNTASSLSTSTAIIDQAIAEWNAATTFQIQRTSTGKNQIIFLEDFSRYGSAVLGVTEVSYAPSGDINSATIYLNEQNYNFTATPGMSHGSTVYLKDVVTHEMGHFLGLAHSEVLDSTMFYQNYPGQSELGADDRSGVRSKYDTGYGKIYGHVKGGSHIGILGVHVQAISRSSGKAVAGITDENGYFEINGLDLKDTYYLYTSNLKNLDSLPSYLANIQTEFCPSAFVSSFFSQCGRENDGIAQGVSLNSIENEVDVGEVSINCSLRIKEDYVYEKLQSSFSNLEIFNYLISPQMEKTHVGFFNPRDLSETVFKGPDKLSIDLSGYPSASNKYLKLRLISQPLGNAVEYSMTVTKNGSTVSGPYLKTWDPQGVYHLDLEALLPLSANGEQNKFEIEIKAKKLSSLNTTYSIPDFLKFGSTQNLPYLLVMSIETTSGPVIDTGVEMSDNSSCLDAPFTYAVAKSKATSNETSSNTTQAAAVATCATIDPPSSGPGSGPGSFLGVLVLGFFLSALPSKFSKRSKKILS